MTAALSQAFAFPAAAHAAGWGVVAGGVLQWCSSPWPAPLPDWTSAVRPRLDLATFFRRFGLAVLGAGGVQIAIFADTIIAIFLPTGSLSYIYYAASISCRWWWSASPSGRRWCSLAHAGLALATAAGVAVYAGLLA